MGFTMFSDEHIGALAAGTMLLILLVLLRRHVRLKENLFRKVLAAGLICCEFALQIWYAIEGAWNAFSLPLQLCSMTLLISAAALLLPGRRTLRDIAFFLGTLGALQALMTPNLDYGFPYFRYFHFFAAHFGILAAALYFFAVERHRPRFRSVVRAFVWLHVLAVPAEAANLTFGTNYMFLARKPATASLLDSLSPWPWYLLELEAVAAVLLLLLYGLARLAERLAAAPAGQPDEKRTRIGS